MAPNQVIGKNNQLPWDIPEEMTDFRSFTLWKIIVMGRKTYEWLGRILPKRRNIMLTRNPSSVKVGEYPTLFRNNTWYVDGGEKWKIEIYTSKEDLEKALWDTDEVLILWWSEIYTLFINDSRSEIRLSEIHKTYDGDTYFPEFRHIYKEVGREKREQYDLVWYKKDIWTPDTKVL